MKYRQTDRQSNLLRELEALADLPRPVYGQRLSLANQAIEERHRHPWIQLSYAAEGVLTVETARARLVAPPHRAVWIPPGMEHGVQCDPNTRIRSIYVIPGVMPYRACEVVEISPLLRALIIEFSGFPVEYDEHGPQGRLVQVLLDQLSTAPVSDLVLPWPVDPRLVQVCGYVAEHVDSELALSSFSTQLGVSDKTLSRLFLKETGMTFRQWRQRSRLLAALPLLERRMRITDVALECGYSNLSAFIAAFRALLGCTPREYLTASLA